jgi:hypothetical protein
MFARHFFKAAADGLVEVEDGDEPSTFEDFGCWVDGESARAEVREFETILNSKHALTKAPRTLIESWRLDVEHFME